MIQREYYYHYNNTAISGIPEKKDSRRLIGGKRNRVNDNNNETSESNSWNGEEVVTTSEGYTSAGVHAPNSRPRMASFGKRVPGESIIEAEERRKRKQITQEFGEHCRALRERPDVHIVSWSEKIPE
jgi:hypothetical protein